jgi:uncharacterized repeat protein (TIGR03803 family)
VRSSSVLAVLAVLALGLVTGCSQSAGFISTPPAQQSAALRSSCCRAPFKGFQANVHFKTLYSFHPVPDGNNPVAGLVDVDNTLYGTTDKGGANPNAEGGTGVVFSVTTTGKERVLYSFKNDGTDGEEPPQGGLIQAANGMLVGVTEQGGSGVATPLAGVFCCGAVYQISTSGTESVLHAFASPTSQPNSPTGSLIQAGSKGSFYGTTVQGGKYKCGTVFEVSRTGAQRVLHNFDYVSASSSSTPPPGADGCVPSAGLIEDASGTFYGTTLFGGSNNGGTVFSVSPTGTEHVLHSFGQGADGSRPMAPLFNVNGTLYGTTFGGGANDGSGTGDGIVFSIEKTGRRYHVLHSFGSRKDGVNPDAGLIEVNGVLYGTTSFGGDNNLGTVFSLSATGKERVLHSFVGLDGTYPQAGLLDVNGKLYGTASGGGKYNEGTVFAMDP